LTSATKSESVSSLGERGPGVSPSGMVPPYWDETNLRARLTKLPKLGGSQQRTDESKRQKQRTYLAGCCCSPPPNALYHKWMAYLSHEVNSHSHPMRTWHLQFLDEWTINNTSTQMVGCQSPLQQGQTPHDCDSLRTCRLRNSDILKNRQSVIFIAASFCANL
jgi:hypothetical protein